MSLTATQLHKSVWILDGPSRTSSTFVWRSTGNNAAGANSHDRSRSEDRGPTDPIIAEVFHRAGLIEKWGRGTNRVAEMCRATGISPPEFAEISGAAVGVFRVDVLGSAGAYPQVAPQVTAFKRCRVTAGRGVQGPGSFPSRVPATAPREGLARAHNSR
jgi:hypothetical protein